MILAMVRHGQTEFNSRGLIQGLTDNPLDETGRIQAKKVVNILNAEKETFDAFLSSPLSRALETAHIIAQLLDFKKPIHIIQRFTERDFYHLDGLSIKEAMPLVNQKNYTYPGYEDDKKLIHRVVKETFKLEALYHNKKVLCVVHSHVIKSLLVYIDPIRYSYTNYSLNNGDILYFKIENQKIKFIDHKKND